ncbi:MAG: hypothetical protein OYH77_08120 [Pseudomonadota bacterium]|nr:hypothetical protein [Pseudomonadota bacterium]
MVVVSAARYEAEPLLAAFPGWQYIEFGVGVFAASVAAVENRHHLDGQDILYVGSCGGFKPFTGIEVVRGESIAWLPTCERMSASYTVADTPVLAMPCRPEFRSVAGCRVICAPNISKRLTHQDEHQVENIEAYAFFHPIHPHIRSAQILLAITNQVGEHAHQQWQANYSQAAEQIQDVVKKLSIH